MAYHGVCYEKVAVRSSGSSSSTCTPALLPVPSPLTPPPLSLHTLTQTFSQELGKKLMTTCKALALEWEEDLALLAHLDSVEHRREGALAARQ